MDNKLRRVHHRSQWSGLVSPTLCSWFPSVLTDLSPVTALGSFTRACTRVHVHACKPELWEMPHFICPRQLLPGKCSN